MVVQTAAKQQERARETRALILDAAAIEFAAHGYSATSINTILATSGRTKGALYFHFASKDAVVQALLDQAHARYTMLAAPWRDSTEDPMVAFAGLIGDVTTAVAHDSLLHAEIRLGSEAVFSADRDVRASRAWEVVAVELATAAYDAGSFTAPFTPVRLVQSIVALIAGQYLLAHLYAEEPPLLARFQEACDTAVAAMATADALAAYRRGASARQEVRNESS